MATERFGNTQYIEHTMRQLANQRENTMRRTERLSNLWRDVRFARRQLTKRPVFTLVAVVTLALGIGANTAIFSAVNSVLLRPLQVPNLDRLYFVHENLPKLNLLGGRLDPSEVLQMLDQPGPFDALTGWVSGSPVMPGQEARRIPGIMTIGRFFDTFGVKPALGRFYRPEESMPGSARVVVLSHDFWRELGADSSIVGRSLQFTGGPVQVIGVAPAEFKFPRNVRIWFPLQVTPDLKEYHGRMVMAVVGRLKAGSTPAMIDDYLSRTAERLHPGSNNLPAELFYSSTGLVKELAGDLRPALLALLGAVGFVLLIACANVASLQLVHGTARTREIAVRTALGADRSTIVRQLLVENLLLSVLGGILGLAVGKMILILLTAAGGTEIPALADVRLDGRVLAFTAVATIVSGVLFGMIPAVRSSRVDLQAGLKEGGRGQSFGVKRNRLLHAGVMMQVALTLVLLLGSTLMIRTVASLLKQDPGFRSDNISTMRISAAGARYREPGALTAFYRSVFERVSNAPGITSVGLITDLPFTGGTDSSPFTIEGKDSDPKGPARHANLLTVSGNYFNTMGIRLVRGRVFDGRDAKTSNPVAIIDEQLAKQFFGDSDPIGQRVSQGPAPATIVGIVGTVSQVQLGEPPKATIYYPLEQHDWYSSVYAVIRSPLTTGAVTGLVRSAVSAADPNSPVFEARALQERVSASLATRRLTMTVLSGLAAVSLLLAIFGLYGVISYVVSQRTTEFGIRLALGAQPADVRSMVVRQGLGLAIGGIVVGLIAAAVGTRALGALLYGVTSRDPYSFALAAGVLGAVAIGASYLPARRATRVSPVDALRRGE